MSTQWHYADRQHQQRGPVTAEWLQAAFARGEIDHATLVWREGMAGWLPLAQVAAELGIAMPAAAPPPRAPGAPRPPAVVKPGRGMPGWAIVLIVLGAMLPVFGILAAIAIPAYQDYTVRAKLSQGIVAGQSLRTVVEETWHAEERCARNDDPDIGAPASHAAGPLQSITLGEDEDGACTIELAFTGLRSRTDTDTLQMTFYDGQWFYRSTIDRRYLPAYLRDEVEPM